VLPIPACRTPGPCFVHHEVVLDPAGLMTAHALPLESRGLDPQGIHAYGGVAYSTPKSLEPKARSHAPKRMGAAGAEKLYTHDDGLE